MPSRWVIRRLSCFFVWGAPFQPARLVGQGPFLLPEVVATPLADDKRVWHSSGGSPIFWDLLAPTPKTFTSHPSATHPHQSPAHLPPIPRPSPTNPPPIPTNPRWVWEGYRALIRRITPKVDIQHKRDWVFQDSGPLGQLKKRKCGMCRRSARESAIHLWRRSGRGHCRKYSAKFPRTFRRISAPFPGAIP